MTSGSLHSRDRIRGFFASIAHRYDLANHLLSGGLDILWRKKAARMIARRNPQTILDLATGSGDLALALQQACPQARVIGADFCPPMLAHARAKGLQALVAADAMHLPFADETFDAATVAFGLRNMASWPDALAELRRVLRPGGVCLILDFSLPAPPLRAPYRAYLHTVLPAAAGLLTGSRNAYDYLADSIEAFPQGEAMIALLDAAGFHQGTAEKLCAGVTTLYTAERK